MIQTKSKNNLFYLTFIGFAGFHGFTGIKGNPSDLLSLVWLGYFSYFWWSKLGRVEDERLIANKHKAGLISFKVCCTTAFILSILILLLDLNYRQLYRAQLLIITLTLAIATNLWAFLTYIFDRI